jgi:diguanylate cyclase (GGDEF)-like protein
VFVSLSGSPRRLRDVVFTVYVLGFSCMAVAAIYARNTGKVSGLHVVLAAFLVAASELAVMHLRFGGERYTYTWSEAAVVLGLVLVPYPQLVLVAPLAVALTHALSGRQPMKVYYNAFSAAIAVTVARFAMVAVSGPASMSPAHGWRYWVGLACAAAVFSAVNSATTTAAVSASQGVPLATVLRRHLPATLGVLAGNTLVAALLLQIRWNAATVAMLPVLLGLLYTTYRGNLSAREDRDTWRELEAASKDLASLDVDQVARVAAERSLRLARADEVEILLRANDGTGLQRYHLDASGEITQGHTDAGALDLLDLQSGALVSSVSESVDGSAANSSHALVLGLDSPEHDQALGALRLQFRSGVRLTDRERQVLVTFGRSVAASVYNAQLYERTCEASRRHEHEATHDSLTGLPNRALLVRRAAEYLSAPDANVSLLLVDLDHFKSINDTLGHPTGDRLLQAAAHRLQAVLRQTDTIARLGGDEFAILLSDTQAPDDAERVAKAVLAALATPVVVDGLRLSVEGSVGIAHYPADSRGVDELLAHADIALYQAKTARGSSRTYSRDHDDSSVSRLTLAAELRSALARDELVLHFQPQHRISDGRLVAAEALVRWHHPQRGLLPPSEFISLAEDSGLAHDFTMYVLNKAVREAASWRELGADLHVAVNLSARNLLDPALSSAVASVLARHALPASSLVLEITERTMMSELEVVERVLGELRQLGVQLSVDDFGTGYSSMTFLTRTAVNELKVDRDFVSRMTVSQSDAAIVRATVELAHGLGLRVVAEGVEDTETLDALHALGCDIAQGFHLDRPMAADAFRGRILAGESTAHRVAAQRVPHEARVVALRQR